MRSSLTFVLIVFTIGAHARGEAHFDVDAAAGRPPAERRILRDHFRGNNCSYLTAQEKPAEAEGFVDLDLNDELLRFLYPIVRRAIAGRLPVKEALADPKLLRDAEELHRRRLFSELAEAKAREREFRVLAKKVERVDRGLYELAKKYFPAKGMPKAPKPEEHIHNRLGAGFLAEGLVRKFAGLPEVQEYLRGARGGEGFDEDAFLGQILSDGGRRALRRELPPKVVDLLPEDPTYGSLFRQLEEEARDADRLSTLEKHPKDFCIEDILGGGREARYHALSQLAQNFMSGRMDPPGRRLRFVVELDAATGAFSLSLQDMKPKGADTRGPILVVPARRGNAVRRGLGLAEDPRTIRHVRCRGNAPADGTSPLYHKGPADKLPVALHCRQLLAPPEDD